MVIYDVKVLTPDGKEESLSNYKNKVLLIVNTATACGFTPQLKGLQNLYDKYKDSGFDVLAFPCNQFGSQEPLGDDKITEACSINFGVQFPIFAKIEVNGPNAHPLFIYLKKEKHGVFNNAIKWNFTKFLVNKQGEVVKRYAPTVEPINLMKDIESLINS
jgi:glutathione peroxidase